MFYETLMSDSPDPLTFLEYIQKSPGSPVYNPHPQALSSRAFIAVGLGWSQGI